MMKTMSESEDSKLYPLSEKSKVLTSYISMHLLSSSFDIVF